MPVVLVTALHERAARLRGLEASADEFLEKPVDGPVLRTFSFDRAQPYAGGQHRGIDVGAAPGSAVVGTRCLSSR